VKIRTKWALTFATTGFVIGVVLCAYTYYVTSSHYRGSPPPLTLYLLLCPPSFGATALDNAGVVEGLIGWFFISLMNAAFYGVFGLGFGLKAEKKGT